MPARLGGGHLLDLLVLLILLLRRPLPEALLLLLIRQGMSDRRLLPVGLVLRCDELRTPAAIHIPPRPDPPIPRFFLSLFSGSEERRVGGGMSLVGGGGRW